MRRKMKATLAERFYQKMICKITKRWNFEMLPLHSICRRKKNTSLTESFYQNMNLLDAVFHKICWNKTKRKELSKPPFIKIPHLKILIIAHDEKHLYCHHPINYRPRNFLAVLKPKKISVFGSFSWGNSKPSRMPGWNLGRNERATTATYWWYS